MKAAAINGWRAAFCPIVPVFGVTLRAPLNQCYLRRAADR